MTGAVLIFRDTTVPRRIEESIRQSEERLRVALKNSPVVVSNQDTELRYTWVHNSLHGFPDQSVIGKRDADLMPTVDSERWSEIKRGVIESGIGTRVEISASIDSQRRSFDLTVEPLRNPEDTIVGVTCAAIDITERKREQAATSRLAAIVESSEDAVVGKTLDGIILSWNPGAERMYGYDPDEIIGQAVSILYPPDRLDEFRQVTERLKRGESVKQHDTIRVRKDGNRIDVSVSVSLVRDGMGRVIGASSIARDITERKQLLVENARLLQELQHANMDLEQRVVQRTIELQGTNKKLQAEIAERQRANEQLRQLSAHLQSAREEERTRVAREIHDELGQVLTVVKMDLSLLERNLSESGKKNTSEDLTTQIRATTQLVDDSIQKMREIIRELRPGILDHLGLRSAIEWQAQEFQARTNIACHLETSEEEIALDLDRSTAVFRIFQETLTNIARHSQATRVDIQLEKNDHLTLKVHDNGRGITESEISNDKSFGILGMRERALIFGGEVEVHGEQGKGTLVSVRIPMEQQRD
ncbi:MAG: PAS domain S-box protein [Chloroflexi bacterium]|nr:PAS domain S-box protein [Chloroflexota bacterium]